MTFDELLSGSTRYNIVRDLHERGAWDGWWTLRPVSELTDVIQARLVEHALLHPDNPPMALFSPWDVPFDQVAPRRTVIAHHPEFGLSRYEGDPVGYGLYETDVVREIACNVRMVPGYTIHAFAQVSYDKLHQHVETYEDGKPLCDEFLKRRGAVLLEHLEGVK